MNRAAIVREKVVKLVKLMTEKSIEVTQRGATANVLYDKKTGKPTTVNIPYIPDDANDEFLSAIEGFLDHEVAHVLYSDFEVLKKAKAMGVSNLHNIIEDSFIERSMSKTFAGSATNLNNVGEWFLKHHTDKMLASDSNPDNAFKYLMVPALRALSGQRAFAEYMKDKWELLGPVLDKFKDYAEKVLPNIKSSQDALDAAISINKLIDGEEPKPTDGDDEGDDEGGSGSGPKGKSGKGKKTSGSPSSDEGEGADGSEEAEDGEGGDGDGETPGSGSDEGDDEDGEFGEDDSADGPMNDRIKDRNTGGHAEKAEREEITEDESTEQGGGSTGVGNSDYLGEGKTAKARSPSSKEIETSIDADYDKRLSELLTKAAADEMKSSEYVVYTKDMDIIEPMEVGKSGRYSDDMVTRMQSRVDHMVGPLQKDLERAVAARSAATWSAGHRSGRLHASALARLTTFDDPRAFRRKHISETKDVAVGILVDCSGSMSGEKIQIAADAAYALCAVLDRMNISHEALGFTTMDYLPSEMRAEEHKLGVSYARHESLYIPIFKSFGERLGIEARKRFAALPEVYWLSQNVDGESVQIAAQRLAQRRESRKILMVLSDGQPACTSSNSAALHSHLKKSVKEAIAGGIEVLAIGILSDAPKKYYPKYVLLNDLKELPTTVIGEIKRMLMKA